MAFPTFEEILFPILKITKEEVEYNTERAVRHIGKIFNLTDEEKELRYSGGKVLLELVRFGRDHLRAAGLIEGYNKSFNITKAGTLLLKQKITMITKDILEEYPDYNLYLKELDEDAKNSADYYKEYGILSTKECFADLTKFILEHNELQKKSKRTSMAKKASEAAKLLNTLVFEDELEHKYREVSHKLKTDLLTKVKSLTALKFEELVLEVIFRLVYEQPNGIKIKDVVKNVGKTGDGGIDGIIIKRDKLKETKIYVQAKCWKDTTISRPEIQKFVGALAGQKAKDGIYITTSKYASTAVEYVKDSHYHINLIDGDELINYMIEYEIGVQKIATYEIKVIDSEYFTQNKQRQLKL